MVVSFMNLFSKLSPGVVREVRRIGFGNIKNGMFVHVATKREYRVCGMYVGKADKELYVSYRALDDVEEVMPWTAKLNYFLAETAPGKRRFLHQQPCVVYPPKIDWSRL